MPGRLSSSPEKINSRSAPPTSLHADERNSFSSAKYDGPRHSDTLDRRKIEKSIGLVSFPANGPQSAGIAGRNDTTKASFLRSDPEVVKMTEPRQWRLSRARGPWSCSILTLALSALGTILLFIIVQAFVTRQLDPSGCIVPWTRPTYVRFNDFDTEHTRFATKYHLYLLRDGTYDEDPTVKGVPVLFIPGNAGSFKQGRILAFEALEYYHNTILQNPEALKDGKTSIDLFAVDFNEDLSAFHGQTVLDQAEYLNDAVSYILSLYHDPQRSQRDATLPDPASVVLIGHSMGGIVARAMLTMPNYQSNSINTIVTLSAPHARVPVSFDAEMVHTYKRINDYWRQAYSQKWANDNPLWHVTLISIAGGGLDTVVPSDFASLESLVPSTHGFTVFTSGIPGVWTGADHLQMTWCTQLMKPVMRSIMEVLDIHRPGQTKSRAERMRSFRKSLLTGMEDVVDNRVALQEASTLLTLDDQSNAIMSEGQRLIIRELGQNKTPKAHIMPIPAQIAGPNQTFTLLSDQRLVEHGAGGRLEVFFCSAYPLQPGQSAAIFSMNMDLSGDASGSTRLACKNAASDLILLPASTRTSTFPFDKAEPFSYLQYQVADLADYHYVAIIDVSNEPNPGWVIAEFSDNHGAVVETDIGLQQLLAFGLSVKLPAVRPLVTEVRLPALCSSLLAFRLTLGGQACGGEAELFTPLLRQYLSEPHESKFFVNVKAANISLHGIAPFMPPALRAQSTSTGVSLQFWSDPTCNSSIDVNLKIDMLGSLGKLVVRYRVVFAAFPLLVVALVLRKQFKVYDESGIFIPFAESLDLCLRSSLPILILILTFLGFALALSSAASNSSTAHSSWFGWRGNATESPIDFTKNDLLLGSRDPIFWFLVPLFGLISIGICAIMNHVVLGVVYFICVPYNYLTIRPAWLRVEDIGGRSYAAPGFSSGSPRRRAIITCILLILVSTIIPYQFAYIDACFVQIYTCIRAFRLVRTSHSGTHQNFFNYAHSILNLMLWILPINTPVLLVWIRNLSVHWLTPFTSHHNVLSIMPFLILVETLTGGKMIPRLSLPSPARHVTSLLFWGLAVFAAVYGISYAYMLHHFVNGIVAWLVLVHFSGSKISVSGLRDVWEGGGFAIGANGVVGGVEGHDGELHGGSKGEDKLKKRP